MTEPVPVTTLYPDPPPKDQPLWIHLEWIQVTAALFDGWNELIERRNQWPRLRQAGVDLEADPIAREDARWLRILQPKIVPLFDEAQKYLPLEQWSAFKSIRTAWDAEQHPKEAEDEWKRLRDYALDLNAKAGTVNHELSVTEFARISGMSESTVSKTRSTLGPLTLELARERHAQNDGSHTQTAPQGSSTISIRDAADQAECYPQTISRAAEKAGISIVDQHVDELWFRRWMRDRQKDARAHPERNVQPTVNVPKYTCLKCQKTQAAKGPCKDMNCDGFAE